VFDKVLIGKAGVTLCLTALGIASTLLLSDPKRDEFKSFFVKVCSLFVALRLGIFLLIFVILRFEAQSDIINYYKWATLVDQGHFPGESEILPLHYGPLFLYVIGFLIKLWNNPKVIVLFSILAEFVLFTVWLSLRQTVANDVTMRRASLLYACCPLSILTSAVGGNNDVFAGLLVSIFVALAFRNRPALSGMFAGISVVTSKILTVTAALPIFLASERKALWVTGAALPILLVYGIWAFVLSINVFAGFQFHGTHYSSGNLPFWIGLLGIDVTTNSARWVVNGLGALVVLAIAALPLLAYRSFSRKDIVPIAVATTVMFMVVSAKSFPHYLLIGLFPIMIIVAKMKLRLGMVVYSAFSVLTSIESSLWFRMFNSESPVMIHETAVSNWMNVVSFGAVETGLLATYGIVVWRCIENYIKALYLHRLDEKG
jgi:hypothetical protein